MLAVYNEDRTQPFAQWQVVDVSFDATANTDTPVKHDLVPPTPEHVHYIVIRQAQAGTVYHDASGTRTAWQDGNIRLRHTVGAAKATLLLFVEHDYRTLLF